MPYICYHISASYRSRFDSENGATVNFSEHDWISFLPLIPSCRVYPILNQSKLGWMGRYKNLKKEHCQRYYFGLTVRFFS